MTSPRTQLPDPRVSPRFAGMVTFCRYPRLEDVAPENRPIDWAVYGYPFDGGVTYRPGARFGPRAVRGPADGPQVAGFLHRLGDEDQRVVGKVQIGEGHVLNDRRPSYVLGQVYAENMEEVGLDLSKRRRGRGMASSDVGVVSYRVPSVTGSFAISHDPIPGHSQQVVDASGSEYGYDQFFKVSTAMTLTAFDIMTSPELSAAAWDEQANWSERYER